MVDGSGPRFSRLDDVPWEEVRKIDFGDHTASVREKWLDFSPRFLSLLADWDPGMMIHAHGHNSDHIVYVLEGSVRCGDVECGPGTHIALDQGDTFGPVRRRPRGRDAVRGDDGRSTVVPGRRGRMGTPARRAGSDPGAEPEDRASRVAGRHSDLSGMSRPFAPGSISLRLYPHNELGATGIVDELRHQATLAVRHGFDGIMTSEHHGGFHGYLPNPLQAAGWCLEAMPTGWAAPSPLLLPLRPPALVAEEIAWLAARFPARVGIGVASGALPDDFEIMHAPMDDLAARFTAGFEELAGMLDGSDPRGLADDAGDQGVHRAPGPDRQRRDGLHRGAARGPTPSGAPLRLAVDARALPRAHRRVPRGRRHSPVRDDPPGLGGRATP